MSTTALASLGDLIASLPADAAEHARTSSVYADYVRRAEDIIADSNLRDASGQREPLGAFGDITLPYTKMGAVDSLDLFGVDELIIFAFYAANRDRYRRAADIGANLGLHSIMMGRLGWNVTAYEPDPHHAELLQKHLVLNEVETVTLRQAAVSDQPGQLEFVRVLGNTTSSHLAGAKDNAYGDLERFPVAVESIADIMPTVDFVKMDAEGQERTIILGTTAEHWRGTDMMVEIGTTENAAAIYTHLRDLGLNAFAQKLGWGQVNSLADMPTSYREGSLFITAKSAMHWA